MRLPTYVRRGLGSSGQGVVRARQGIGLYLENEGGSRPDFHVWLFAACGVLLLGGLSSGLQTLLRLLLAS
jgi:hypothetical protein